MFQQRKTRTSPASRDTNASFSGASLKGGDWAGRSASNHAGADLQRCLSGIVVQYVEDDGLSISALADSIPRSACGGVGLQAVLIARFGEDLSQCDSCRWGCNVIWDIRFYPGTPSDSPRSVSQEQTGCDGEGDGPDWVLDMSPRTRPHLSACLSPFWSAEPLLHHYNLYN